MAVASPYVGLDPSQWRARTEAVIAGHPLAPEGAVEATLAAWDSIFQSSIGGFFIGQDIFPKPQMMGFFLHELIPLELAKRFPGQWREDRRSDEKDLVYIPDPSFSVEIKTSSNPSKIYGNRSYAQKATARQAKKEKSGYYLAVNFQPFKFTGDDNVDKSVQPRILKIRFGWLDHDDWTGQAAQSGQQASLSPEVEAGKLKVIFPRQSAGQYDLFP